MTHKLTQKQKVLKALRDAQGEKVSTRYFKQQLLISEVNGRISELRAEGYTIVTEGHDEFGFAYHRLTGQPTRTVSKVEIVNGVAIERRVEQLALI